MCVNNYPFQQPNVPALVTYIDEVSTVYPLVNKDTSVRKILRTGSMYDVDILSAPPGIAVSHVDHKNGSWYFQCAGNTGNSSAWLPLNGVDLTAAIVLDTNCTIRFIPADLYFGNATLTYFGWDMSDGAQVGSAVNITYRGVNGAYSANSSQLIYLVLEVKYGRRPGTN